MDFYFIKDKNFILLFDMLTRIEYSLFLLFGYNHNNSFIERDPSYKIKEYRFILNKNGY